MFKLKLNEMKKIKEILEQVGIGVGVFVTIILASCLMFMGVMLAVEYIIKPFMDWLG